MTSRPMLQQRHNKRLGWQGVTLLLVPLIFRTPFLRWLRSGTTGGIEGLLVFQHAITDHQQLPHTRG